MTVLRQFRLARLDPSGDGNLRPHQIDHATVAQSAELAPSLYLSTRPSVYLYDRSFPPAAVARSAVVSAFVPKLRI